MDNNPIKYSDLVSDDGAIQAAINQLSLLRDAYKDLQTTIKSHAREVETSMKAASGATEEGRAVTRKAADDTSRLEKAQNELAFAMSEAGVKVAELKMLIAEKNKESKNEAMYVNATAKSYDEMKAELTILTTQYKALSKDQALYSAGGTELLNKILALKSSIKELDVAMKIQEKTTAQNAASTKAAVTAETDLEKAKRKLAFATSAEQAEILLLNVQIKEATQITKLNAIINSEVEGSYNRLSAQYALNKIALAKLSEAERTTTESGMRLVEETNEIYQAMSRMQEATGVHTLSVGNYKRAWDGLGMGVSQVVRELPAAAVSMNTFFLGISNNIPILMDEIKKVREANAIAAAAGEKTVSVMKKLFMAFFSWNTILVVVLTVLSMFGGKMLKWIGSLFSAEEAILRVTSAQHLFVEALNKGREESQKELVRMKLLYLATINVNKSMDYRLKAVKELKKLYPDQLKNISDEAILAGKASAAYLLLSQNIVKAAMSRAYEDKIVENSKEILNLNNMLIGYKALAILKEREAKASKKSTQQTQQVAKDYQIPTGGAGVTVIPVTPGMEKETDRLVDQYDDLQKKVEQTRKQIDQLNLANQRLAGMVDVTALFTPDPKPKKEPKAPKDRTEQIEKANLEIRKKYAESVTALEVDELEKQKAAYQDAYIAETEALMNQYKNDKDLTEESRGLILQIIKNWGIKLDVQTKEVNDEIAQRELAKQAETLQLKLDATEEGSYEEAAARLNIMENSRQQELLANSRLIESQRQDEKDINDKWNNIITTERQKSVYEMGMDALDIQQKYDASEFDLLRSSEAQKTRFKLQQEKERWQKILEYAKEGNLNLSALEIKTIENLIKKIDQDMADTKKFDFYSLFGLNPTDEQKEAVNTVISETIDNLKEALDAEIELADIAIQKAQEKVSVKQKALDDEIEARNNGYAYNVSQAQRELDVEKNMLEKAQKEKQKLVAAQQRLDTIAQASSLITAAANIWSAFSPLGPFGIALAIAGIATMFGSFAFAKIKTAQVTKAQAQVYGEGGFEVLDGGSHQSGNDINIGNMSDGRERRAEGGEGLAIIAKSKMRRYRGLVPDVIDSINKGIFERKYSRAFNTENINLGVISGGADLKNLENDVREIRQQGERKDMFDSNGRHIVFYKNLKTTYRS